MEKIEKNQFYGICTIEEIFGKMISLWSTRHCESNVLCWVKQSIKIQIASNKTLAMTFGRFICKN